MRDRLVGILADFVSEHYKVSLSRSAMVYTVTLLLNGRRAQASRELSNASPMGFTADMAERMRHEADNPAVQWVIKNNVIPTRCIIGLKEARDIIVMLELVGGLCNGEG